jgi:gliding motility-associated-like protein
MQYSDYSLSLKTYPARRLYQNFTIGFMKKLLLICLLVLSLLQKGWASHITGGEMYYSLVSVNGNIYTYAVTLKLFQRCNSGRQFPDPAIISVFNKGNGARVTDISAPKSNNDLLQITDHGPCITNPPTVCFEVATYNFSVQLAADPNGYVLASQVNFRIAGINNLQPGYSNIGATYTAEIPGFGSINNGPDNESARFVGSDLVVICANNRFTYSFAAEDNDGDNLSYYFCSAYASTAAGGGGPGGGAGNGIPPNAPPYPVVPYGGIFSSNAPLGGAVQINPTTGLITGIAPPPGIYVVTVCVEEKRNGVVIATQRKDIQINVADCNIASAALDPAYSLCKESYSATILNQSNSPLIQTYNWELFGPANNLIYTSTDPAFNYTFPANGLYKLKLIINKNGQCSDSATTELKVFPGFKPDFTSTGICITKPTIFTDRTTSVFGTPESWNWNFGDPIAPNAGADTRNTQYTYPSLGDKQVRLIATDSRGCVDTVFKTITIIDKPPITLAFRDTLICINDQLPLQASGTGNFSWTPLLNITNPTSGTPIVSPPVTTTYYVKLDTEGCINTDSVKVNVVNFVTLSGMPDTTICQTDTIQLRINSDGLQYYWQPANQIINPRAKNPLAVTNALTDYRVRAVIGGCDAFETIRVITVPYPVVNAGPPQTICYNTTTQLNGSTDGSSWSWFPPTKVSDATILNPIARPTRTTDYILTAYDTKGCPKPSRDTIRITMLPKMNVFATDDTAVVVNQPLELIPTGAVRYQWVPSTYLLTAENGVIGIFPFPTEGIRYKLIGYSEEGCIDSSSFTVKVFKTNPSVFVPTAFTPNNDGLNDLLAPVAVGMKTIQYFSIFNRWGQPVFSTTINGKGWDGRINGVIQSTGTYVWAVKAVDFTGKAYFEKGVTTLIR